MIWLRSLPTKIRHHRGTSVLMEMKSENNDSYFPWLVELLFEDLVEHFAILLTIEESDFLKEVCETFKARAIRGREVLTFQIIICCPIY